MTSSSSNLSGSQTGAGSGGADGLTVTNLAAAAAVPAHQPPSAPPPATHPRQGNRPRCRFFGSKNGCRAGDACPFIHDPAILAGDDRVSSGAKHGQARRKADRTASSGPMSQRVTAGPQQHDAGAEPQVISASAPPQRRYQAAPVDSSRVVQRPVPAAQKQDPREFQLQQLRRRFSPQERIENESSILTFKLVPSDPDFPFEIEALECVLHIPTDYPRVGTPSLRVTNKEMGRGYQINVEKGFDALVAKSPQATLLRLVTALDKNLEAFLSEQKAETIKLIPNVGSRPSQLQKGEVPPAEHQTAQASQAKVTARPVVTQPRYSPEQRSQAEVRREQETRQLEARLARVPLFSKSGDGITFTVPVEPRRRGELPVPLLPLKSVRLIVPALYNLQPCRIEVPGVNPDATRLLERAFEQRAKEHPEMTLMAHINYLSQNMHVMAITPTTVEKAIEVPKLESLQIETPKESQGERSQVDRTEPADEEKSHIRVIPRPPEWTMIGEDGEEEYDSGEDTYDSEEESSDGEIDEKGDASNPNEAPSGGPTPDRGIAISFPSIELYGIELLELTNMNLTVKCDRCKETMDVHNIGHNTKGDITGARSESCRKCASELSIGYRSQLVHANSVRAGYLDVDGCTVVDLLASTFMPTCSDCSTPYARPGVVSVRGDSTTAFCRECHRKMNFSIRDVKFLRTALTPGRTPHAPIRKQIKERLGLVAGQELPRRGRCAHYSKSFRWFRFGCCSKVFPCDRCHDAATDHPNEFATRMICGFCSREQNYRPENCGFCHSTLVGNRGSGFWEGGKGTRDKTRMSRKDPRKYKRRPGTAPKA